MKHPIGKAARSTATRRPISALGSLMCPRIAVLRSPLRRWAGAVLAGLLTAWVPAGCAQPASAPLGPVDLAYFGLVMNREGAKGQLPWPSVQFGSWRLWDTYVAWPNLQPERGHWTFAVLDKMVAEAQDHGVELLMGLAHSPKWASARPDEPGAYAPGAVAEPANMDDWRNYVRTVGQRYKGRIAAYEVWNEPSDKSHFSGTVDKLVELTCEASRILKAIDPAVRIVSAGSAGGGIHIRYLDNFLSRGGAACIDVVAHHFYVPRFGPEAMVPLIREVKAVMRKNGVAQLPLWNTETGWWLGNVDGEQAPENIRRGGWRQLDAGLELGAAIQRTLLLSRAEGVERIYWYQWVDSVMGLADAAGRPKPGTRFWDEVVNKMLGQVVGPCVAALPNFSCQLTPARGAGQVVAWRDPSALVSREGPAPMPLDEAAVPAWVPAAAPADRASAAIRR